MKQSQYATAGLRSKFLPLILFLVSTSLAHAQLDQLKADASAGKGPLAKLNWKTDEKAALIDSAFEYWDAFRMINLRDNNGNKVPDAAPFYKVRPEVDGCLIFMDKFLMRLDGTLPSRASREELTRRFWCGAYFHKRFFQAVSTAIKNGPSWESGRKEDKAGKNREFTAFEGMLTALALAPNEIGSFEFVWKASAPKKEDGETDVDWVKRIVRTDEPNDPYWAASMRLDPMTTYLGGPRRAATPPAPASASPAKSSSAGSEVPETVQSESSFRDVDWKQLIGKDVHYTYIAHRSITTFGGDKKEARHVQTTRMRVREVKDGKAFVLFWDDVKQKEPIFAGWIDTTINSELPALDIESHPAFILGGQMQGGDYSNMRRARVGGQWAKNYNPADVKWANDIVPFYGLAFRSARPSGKQYGIRIVRPATFFSGEGNNFGDIMVTPTLQKDGSWIIDAKLDLTNATDKRLGGGDIRARYSADGLLQSFVQSATGKFKIDGVAGEGSIKWTIERSSTPPPVK